MGEDADLLKANKRYVEENLKRLVRDATKLCWQEEFGVKYTLGFSVGEKSHCIAFGWQDLQDKDASGRLLQTLRVAVH